MAPGEAPKAQSPWRAPWSVMMPDTAIIIRPSSLPQWPDCGARTVARVYPKLIESAGFELRQVPPSVGASVGTGTHAAMLHAMTCRMKGSEATRTELEGAAAAAFREDIKDGVVWDDTTRTEGAAIKQATRQAVAILQTVARDLQPVAVEEELDADIGDDFMLRGHIDLRTVEPGIWDWKTGKVMRANMAQYGGYSMVVRANFGAVTKLIREVFVRRVGETKPQPDPEVESYDDVPLAERVAWESIEAMKDSLQRFMETGNPWSFVRNPNSLMCAADYCPAHGTAFCKVHKRAA